MPSLHVGHISDTHLGRKSAGDPTGAIRLQTLRRALEELSRAGAAAIVVAGDVFDSPSVGTAIVQQAVRILQQVRKPDGDSMPIVVIPGNHDPADASTLWTAFQKALTTDSQVHLALVPTRLKLCDDRLWVDAYPCESRFSPDPPWAQPIEAPGDAAERSRVVVAHGTLIGGPVPEGEHDAYPFDEPSLRSLGADYVALGHFHSTFQPWPAGDECTRDYSYSGTPEPDQFGGDSGYALLVGLSRSEAPRVRRIRCARRDWQQLAVTSASDIAQVEKLLDQVSADDPSRFVIRLKLDARLAPEDRSRLEQVVASLESLGAQVDQRGEVRTHFSLESFALDRLPSGAVRAALESLHDELRTATDPERREVLIAALQLGWEKFDHGGSR